VRNPISGNTELLWRAVPLVEDAHMQYYFNKQTLLMNFISPDMEGFLSPTDSRNRPDLRFYEEGHVEQAEAQKIIIEQR
jgi:oxysterol-binding protein-related protein 3/6/7